MKKIGVIGCGGRMRGVLNCIPELGTEIEIAAIYDPEEVSIETSRKELRSKDFEVSASYQELVARQDIEWVFIGSWNCFHADQVIAAFEAGKNVFCEKPLATTAEDCVRILAAWRKSGRQFSIGFTLRYSPFYRKLKEILQSGKIGELVSMEFNETLSFNHGGYINGNWRRLRENAGTHLLEKCCHDIDLVNWFVGAKAKRVASFGGCNFFKPENIHHQERIGKSPDGNAAYQLWPDPWAKNPFTADKDIFDNQVAIIEFENQIRTTFHTNCNTAIPERRMYMCGTEGTLRADVLNGKIEVARIGWDNLTEIVDTGAAGGHGGGDRTLGKSLGGSVLRGEAPFTGVEDGLRSAFTAYAIDEAADTGRVVDLAPYWDKSGL